MVNDYIIFCSIKLWQIFQLFAFGDYSICLLVQLTVYYINILFSQDTYHFQLYGQSCWYHTRFRPGWKEFLEDMKKYYELHIFTMGSRMYAHTIARMLDPTGELFADRIRSRDESFDMFSKYRDLRFVIVWREEMREGGSEGGRKWGREEGREGGRKEGSLGGLLVDWLDGCWLIGCMDSLAGWMGGFVCVIGWIRVIELDRTANGSDIFFSFFPPSFLASCFRATTLWCVS